MKKINYVNEESSTENKPSISTENKSSIWDSIASNLGSWLSGAADITRASKGVPEEVNYIQTSSGSSNNSMIYMGIGAVALIIILFFLFKK